MTLPYFEAQELKKLKRQLAKKTREVEDLKNLLPAAEFGTKIAKAMKDISSSHVYFIVQQAYGDLDWKEVVEIFDNVLLHKFQPTERK